MATRTKDALRRCALLVGRRNLYRASRFLMATACGDVTNDPRHNGESMVQEVALMAAGAAATVFDVGANTGEWTAMLLPTAGRMNAQVQVHAFEPCAGTFAKLSARASAWPNVTPVNKACSRSSGTGTMRVYKDAPRTNTLVVAESGDGETEPVLLTSIDDYCQGLSIARVDLLKVDAEGHDLEVMIGASEMLRRRAVKVLQFEYNQRWIGARNYLRDVFSMVKPLGYSIGKVAGTAVEFYTAWHWEMESYREGNYVACVPEIVSCFPSREPGWIPLNGEHP